MGRTFFKRIYEHRTEYSPQTQYPSLPCRNPNTTFKPLCAFGGQPRLACRTSRAELNIRSDFDRVVSAFSGIPDIHWQLSGDHRTCTTYVSTSSPMSSMASLVDHRFLDRVPRHR